MEVGEELAHPIVTCVRLEESPRPAGRKSVERPPEAGKCSVTRRDRLPHVLVEHGAALGEAGELAVVRVPPVDHVGRDPGDSQQIQPVRRVAHAACRRSPCHRDSVVTKAHPDRGADDSAGGIDGIAITVAHDVLEIEDRPEVWVVHYRKVVLLALLIVESIDEHLLPCLSSLGVCRAERVAVQRESIGHFGPFWCAHSTIPPPMPTCEVVNRWALGFRLDKQTKTNKS